MEENKIKGLEMFMRTEGSTCLKCNTKNTTVWYIYDAEVRDFSRMCESCIKRIYKLTDEELKMIPVRIEK